MIQSDPANLLQADVDDDGSNSGKMFNTTSAPGPYGIDRQIQVYEIIKEN